MTLIVFSGTDGSGKTTQIRLLSDVLFANTGWKIPYLWARGGYTPGFDFLKRIIRSVGGSKVPSNGKSEHRDKVFSNSIVKYLWLNLAMLDLIFFWAIYLRIKLLINKIVVCDRYLIDTKLDFLLNFSNVNFENYLLWKILKFLAPVPDVYFFLWVPVEISLTRSLEKNEPFPDEEEVYKVRLEKYLTPSFFECYFPHFINSTKSKELIHKEILDVVGKVIRIS